jgi:hypothetical protein
VLGNQRADPDDCRYLGFAVIARPVRYVDRVRVAIEGI